VNFSCVCAQTFGRKLHFPAISPKRHIRYLPLQHLRRQHPLRHPKAQIGPRIGLDPLEQSRLARHQEQQPRQAEECRQVGGVQLVDDLVQGGAVVGLHHRQPGIATWP
jgi:hypothetical protein